MNTWPVEDLARTWIDEYNKGPGWVEATCAPDFYWIENPSQAFPKGREGGYDFLLKAANGNLNRNPDRKMTLVRAVACSDDEAAVEWTWTGSSPAGGRMNFKAMSFLKFADDKLVHEIDYLCQWDMPENVKNFFNADGTWRTEAIAG